MPWDPLRLPEIAEFVGLTVDEVIEKYYGHRTEDGQRWEFDDHKRTPCQFLKKEGNRKICSIYPVRPEGCRAYPFNTDFGRCGVDCPAAKEVYKKLGIKVT